MADERQPEETMEEADWLVDFGPGAGELGGEIVSQGTPKQVMADPKSLTGAFLSGREEIEVPVTRRRPGKQKLLICGAKENNLQNIDVEIPLGLFVAVTGVSGAGKRALAARCTPEYTPGLLSSSRQCFRSTSAGLRAGRDRRPAATRRRAPECPRAAGQAS